MKNYIKLVNFELNRFLKFYIALIGLVVAVQLVGIVVFSWHYMNSAETIMADQRLSVEAYVQSYGMYSFERFIYTGWFMMPIIMAITVLLLYAGIIWYRDWFGKSKFMYRLLMLPTARHTIYFAKLTTVLLLTFGMLTVQIGLILVEQLISKLMVAEAFRQDVSFFDVYQLDILVWLYPSSFSDFLLIYGFGTLCVALLFTAILLERSYQWKGIVLSVLYGIAAFFLLCMPFILNDWLGNYFYAGEVLAFMICISLVILGSAIWLAGRLLTHKIKV